MEARVGDFLDSWRNAEEKRKILRILFSPNSLSWLELCRYLALSSAPQKGIEVAGSILYEFSELEKKEMERKGKSWPGMWKGHSRPLFFRLALECAQVINTHLDISDESARRDKIYKELSKVVEEIDNASFPLAHSLGHELVDAFLSDREMSTPSYVARSHLEKTCRVPLLSKNSEAKLFALCLSAMPSKNDKGGGLLYPAWPVAFIEIGKDFGEQIDRAQKLIKKRRQDWPSGYDIRWNVIPNETREIPARLHGPSAGIAMAFLLDSLVKELLAHRRP